MQIGFGRGEFFMMYSRSELERLIVEKNVQLNKLSRNLKAKSEEIHEAYTELDHMLFIYYKLLGGKRDKPDHLGGHSNGK